MHTQLSTDPNPDVIRTLALQRLKELERRKRVWRADMPTFAADALVIRPKDPLTGQYRAARKLVLNNVQRELDALLDEQKAETGKVRAVIVKARQLGISTYIAGRFYHRTRHDPQHRSLIMTHRDDATANLLDMVKRFHVNDPHPPPTRTRNDGQLIFGNDSGFNIATAAAVSSGAGRSFTFQLAHLSELAYWKNANEHLTAVLDAIPNAPGSEIIIESTANGSAGPFFQMAMAAMKNLGEYRLIFLPWFEHEEYATEPPEGWMPGEAMLELQDRFTGKHEFSPAQLYWAENENTKKAVLDGDDLDEICWRFQQEYPSTIHEAFRAGRQGGYIASSVVGAARNRWNVHQPDMPLILGCDFATGGGGGDNEYASAGDDVEGSEDGDANFFIARRGRVMGRELHERFRDRSSISVANRLQAHIDRLQPDRVFMDKGGGGAGVFDILCQRGYGRFLELVDFGSGAKPVDRRKYRNKRAEMYGEFREWLNDGDIPDDEELEADITAPWVAREDESGLQLASKRAIRAKLKLSPDGADGCVLTFAAPVRKRHGGAIMVGGAGVR